LDDRIIYTTQITLGYFTAMGYFLIKVFEFYTEHSRLDFIQAAIKALE